MEKESISKEISKDKERLNTLEKAFHKASNLFFLTVCATPLPWIGLVNSTDGPNEGYYFALAMASVPVIYASWLYSMSKKTEEYAELREKYSRPLF